MLSFTSLVYIWSQQWQPSTPPLSLLIFGNSWFRGSFGQILPPHKTGCVSLNINVREICELPEDSQCPQLSFDYWTKYVALLSMELWLFQGSTFQFSKIFHTWPFDGHIGKYKNIYSQIVLPEGDSFILDEYENYQVF